MPRLLIAAIAAQFIGGAAAAQRVTLRRGHLGNEEDTRHKAAATFGGLPGVLTVGRIAVGVHPDGTLGTEMDLIHRMRPGTADMIITGESLQNWAPMAALLTVPCAYASLEHMDEVAGSALGDRIEAEIIAKSGVRPIARFARGPRNLTANHAITTPDELNGLKLRVPNVPLFLSVWPALGAAPTPMAFSEVFTSLQNGTIEGQENPLALISLRPSTKCRATSTRPNMSGRGSTRRFPSRSGPGCRPRTRRR